MKDKIEKMKAIKRASQLPEVLDDFEINEVYAYALGKEKRGKVRGFGLGVTPDQVPGIVVQKRGVHLEIQAMREQHDTEIKTIRKESQEKEDKLGDEMSRQTLSTTDKLKSMEIAMKEQGALLAVLLGAYSPRDLLATTIPIQGGFSCQPSINDIQPSYEQNMDDLD